MRSSWKCRRNLSDWECSAGEIMSESYMNLVGFFLRQGKFWCFFIERELWLRFLRICARNEAYIFLDEIKSLRTSVTQMPQIWKYRISFPWQVFCDGVVMRISWCLSRIKKFRILFFLDKFEFYYVKIPENAAVFFQIVIIRRNNFSSFWRDYQQKPIIHTKKS